MSRTSRRTFAKSLAAAAVVSGATIASAQKADDAFVAVVQAQSGKYLDAADLERIRADFKDYVPLLERLRAVKLSNSDEPDFTFASLTKRWP